MPFIPNTPSIITPIHLDLVHILIWANDITVLRTDKRFTHVRKRLHHLRTYGKQNTTCVPEKGSGERLRGTNGSSSWLSGGEGTSLGCCDSVSGWSCLEASSALSASNRRSSSITHFGFRSVIRTSSPFVTHSSKRRTILTEGSRFINAPYGFFHFFSSFIDYNYIIIILSWTHSYSTCCTCLPNASIGESPSLDGFHIMKCRIEILENSLY